MFFFFGRGEGGIRYGHYLEASSNLMSTVSKKKSLHAF